MLNNHLFDQIPLQFISLVLDKDELLFGHLLHAKSLVD